MKCSIIIIRTNGAAVSWGTLKQKCENWTLLGKMHWTFVHAFVGKQHFPSDTLVTSDQSNHRDVSMHCREETLKNFGTEESISFQVRFMWTYPVLIYNPAFGSAVSKVSGLLPHDTEDMALSTVLEKGPGWKCQETAAWNFRKSVSISDRSLLPFTHVSESGDVLTQNQKQGGNRITSPPRNIPEASV